MTRSAQFFRQWSAPLVIALTTAFGLFSALLSEGGVWWVLSWIALSLPLLVVLRYWPVRRLFNRKPPL